MDKSERRILQLLSIAKRKLKSVEISRILNMGSGVMYPKLYHLEREEMISSQWDDPTATGRRLRVYFITDYGYRVLDAQSCTATTGYQPDEEEDKDEPEDTKPPGTVVLIPVPIVPATTEQKNENDD